MDFINEMSEYVAEEGFLAKIREARDRHRDKRSLKSRDTSSATTARAQADPEIRAKYYPQIEALAKKMVADYKRTYVSKYPCIDDGAMYYGSSNMMNITDKGCDVIFINAMNSDKIDDYIYKHITAKENTPEFNLEFNRIYNTISGINEFPKKYANDAAKIHPNCKIRVISDDYDIIYIDLDLLHLE